MFFGAAVSHIKNITGEDMSEVQEKIKQIIVDELGVDEAEVTENARFIEMTPQGHLESVAHGLNT